MNPELWSEAACSAWNLELWRLPVCMRNATRTGRQCLRD